MNTKLTHQMKLDRLMALSEDQFRDSVVRQLFMIQGFHSYRDLCGTDEEGKDCLMLRNAEFGKSLLYAIQTKKGRLNMSSKVADNVETAITQLRTALNSTITLVNPPRVQKPDQVYLCSSGSANKAAREHILKTLNDTRLTILDGDEIVQHIDSLFPHYWLNITHQKKCYLESFRNHLLHLSDVFTLTPPSSTKTLLPYVDEAYVSQSLFRYSSKLSVKRGNVTSESCLEEIEDIKLPRSHYKIAFIEGEGGSGKTTLLRRLALNQCELSLSATDRDTCIIPILFKASDLIQADDLEQATYATIRNSTGDCDTKLDEDDFSAGRITILVDGLDELIHHVAINHVLGLIDTLHQKYAECRIYATCRPVLQVREFSTNHNIPLFEISEFSIKQAGAIVRRAVEGQISLEAQAVEVLRQLQEVHGMKLSPMLVTVFAATPNFQTSDIPPNITSIFRKFANLMLGQWDAQKGLSQQFEYDLKHRILADIALTWHNRYKSETDLAEFTAGIQQILTQIGYGDRAEALSEEILRSGLLISDNGTIRFRHLLFQEYFAGSAIESYRDIESVVAEEWWRNVIVFAFGSRPNRGDELVLLADQIEAKDGLLQYPASITLGLATQACYMTSSEIRLELISRITGLLARSFNGLLKDEEHKSQYPLSAFIYHFLEARSAISSNLILQMSPTMIERDDQEYYDFLRICGAIEAGHILAVKDEAIAFDPADERLLLGLHLLAFFVLKLRVSTKEEKDAAKDIITEIAPRIRALVQKVWDEFKGQVMELQQGKIKVIDAPIATPEGQYELRFDDRDI